MRSRNNWMATNTGSMAHKKGGLVSIGEIIGGLSGPGQALREASPQGALPLHPGRSSEAACYGQ